MTKYFDILILKLVGIKEKIILVDPIIVQGIKTLKDIGVFLDPLQLNDKEILILPVNNYQEPLVNENISTQIHST